MIVNRRHFMLGVVLVGTAMAGAARVASDTVNKGADEMAAKQEISAIDIAAEGLSGLSALYGAPKTEDFTLTGDVSEFRIELLNFFPAAERKAEPPRIIEATWSVSAKENLTVWYRQTDAGRVYVHHMVWGKGQEF